MSPSHRASAEVILGVLDRPRLADRVQQDVVVLAAGRYTIDDHVADRHVRGRERGVGLRLARPRRP